MGEHMMHTQPIEAYAMRGNPMRVCFTHKIITSNKCKALVRDEGVIHGGGGGEYYYIFF